MLLKGAVTYLFDKKRIAIFLHSKIWLPFSVDRNTTGVMHKYDLIIRSKELSGLLSQKTIEQIQVSVAALRGQGAVVRRPISAFPGLNFNPGFFIPLFKSPFWTIFSILFRVFNHQIIDKRNDSEFSIKAFKSEIRFHTNPGLI